MPESDQVPGARQWARVPWVFHPPLLATVPILSLYAHNAHLTPPGQLVTPILAALGGGLLVWLALAAVLRDARRAGLVASLGVVLFFTITRLDIMWNELLQDYWVGRPEPYRAWPGVLVGGELALFAASVYWVLARLRDPRRLTSFLNVFALVLVVLPAGEAVATRAGRPEGPRSGAPALAQGIAPGPRSDIYYIILDAYARSDVMKELFSFDNEPFLRRLEDRGFYVARRSTANYCQTPLCLSSSLNSTYLDTLVEGLETDQNALTGLIGDNAVVKTLRPLGYKFVTFSTGFDPTEHPEADVYRSPFGYTTEFHQMLLDRTPIRPLLPNPKQRDSFTMARERILYLLDKLPDVARDPAPTFTFAHILAPHPPFLFGEEGEDVGAREVDYNVNDGEHIRDRSGGTGEVYAKGYRAQAIFITRRIERVIEQILKNSPEPPIILLQSDHGSGLRLHMQSLEKSDLHERMSILNTYYFPKRRYEELNDRITPVNSFRVVFNTFFGTKLPLLPDRSFFSTWREPYRFIDVTDRVRSPDVPSAP